MVESTFEICMRGWMMKVVLDNKYEYKLVNSKQLL